MPRLDAGDVVAVNTVGTRVTLVGGGALWADDDDATYSHDHNPDGDTTSTGYVEAPLEVAEGTTTATLTVRVSSDVPADDSTFVNALVAQYPPGDLEVSPDVAGFYAPGGGTVTEITMNLGGYAGAPPLSSVLAEPSFIRFGYGVGGGVLQCVKVHAAWLNVDVTVGGLRNVPRSSYLKFLDEAGSWRTAKLIGGSR